MSDEDWNAGFVKCLGVRLAGDLIGDVDERGEPIVGDTLLLLLNAHHEADPVHAAGDQAPSIDWERLLDTADPDAAAASSGGQDRYPICRAGRWRCSASRARRAEPAAVTQPGSGRSSRAAHAEAPCPSAAHRGCRRRGAVVREARWRAVREAS